MPVKVPSNGSTGGFGATTVFRPVLCEWGWAVFRDSVKWLSPIRICKIRVCIMKMELLYVRTYTWFHCVRYVIVVSTGEYRHKVILHITISLYSIAYKTIAAAQGRHSVWYHKIPHVNHNRATVINYKCFGKITRVLRTASITFVWITYVYVSAKS